MLASTDVGQIRGLFSILPLRSHRSREKEREECGVWNVGNVAKTRLCWSGCVHNHTYHGDLHTYTARRSASPPENEADSHQPADDRRAAPYSTRTDYLSLRSPGVKADAEPGLVLDVVRRRRPHAKPCDVSVSGGTARCKYACCAELRKLHPGANPLARYAKGRRELGSCCSRSCAPRRGGRVCAADFIWFFLV